MQSFLWCRNWPSEGAVIDWEPGQSIKREKTRKESRTPKSRWLFRYGKVSHPDVRFGYVCTLSDPGAFIYMEMYITVTLTTSASKSNGRERVSMSREGDDWPPLSRKCNWQCDSLAPISLVGFGSSADDQGPLWSAVDPKREGTNIINKISAI